MSEEEIQRKTAGGSGGEMHAVTVKVIPRKPSEPIILPAKSSMLREPPQPTATSGAKTAAGQDTASRHSGSSVKPKPKEPQPRVRDYAKATWQLFAAGLERLLWPAAIIVVIVLVLGGGWKLWSVRSKDPHYTNARLIEYISHEAGISNDPNPAVLTVVDKEKTNQPFLNESKDGDKILLFYKSARAVLYRPSTNEVIKTGLFNPPDAKVQIRVGTLNTKRVEDIKTLLKSVKNTSIVTQDESVRTDYSQTYVINVRDRYPDETAAVARALNAQVRTMPQSESLPDADILVIAGAK